MHLPACEVVDHAAVVEIDRDPAGPGEFVVQLVDDVQGARDLRDQQLSEPLKARSGIVSQRTIDAEPLPLDPLIDEQRTARGLDHPVETRQRGMTAAPPNTDGVSEESYPIGMRHKGLQVLGIPRCLDEITLAA